jgi:hypothetical protein
VAARTRYARSGDLHIAYQVVGDGPFDLVFVPGWVSSVEACWEEPALAAFLERLASFSRSATVARSAKAVVRIVATAAPAMPPGIWYGRGT